MEHFYSSNTYTCICIVVSLCFFYFVRKEIYQIFFSYGVPFIPTNNQKVDIFIKHISIHPHQHFLDLGSGDGRILEAVEKKCEQDFGKHHNITFTGIENSPGPFELSLQNKQKKQLTYTVKKSDFFKEDFSQYDVIYSYTITYLMKKIWKKVQQECSPGTLFYSNSFKIPGVQEIEKIQTSTKNFIYVYKV